MTDREIIGLCFCLPLLGPVLAAQIWWLLSPEFRRRRREQEAWRRRRRFAP